MPVNKMRPIHPGEILREDILVPLEMSVTAFARLLDLPPEVMTEIINEKRSVSAEVAERIKRRFGGDVDFWLRLQQSYDDKMALLAPGESWPAPG
ncbi:HigA family addiction module antidote protein [Duganella sp. FT80W]|uniref:HigA family addiction module antidote protein n=1 Tax=Duganella guangzhouensis TaxID=2666084 RepID=A0A6I2L6Y6_9BURK|nr:HigA family addiction module antitoxin [Duganella guangzhouensis]MRW93908.1 HigA family addiction module antidote protein [Duganella guangzhouensis]